MVREANPTSEATARTAEKQESSEPLTLDLAPSWEGRAAPVVPAEEVSRTRAASSRPDSQERSTDMDADGWPRLEDLDAGFGAILQASLEADSVGPSDEPGERPPEARELFKLRANGRLQTLRDLVIGIGWNEALSEDLLAGGSALGEIKVLATELGLSDLSRIADEFVEALAALKIGAGVLPAATRERILDAYAVLATDALVPDWSDEDRSKRESAIVRALLLQIPGISERTIEKLRAAGLSRLDALGSAKGPDIAEAVGIEPPLALRIVEKVNEYRRDAGAMPFTSAVWRERLAERVDALKQAHARYEEAAAAWSSDSVSRKKQLRDARNDALLQIAVLMARHGELDLLDEMERLSFERKIEVLEKFVGEARGDSSVS